jgi:acylphosphatase
MLNKLSYNLANSLNESESEVLKISKKVLIESDGVKTKKLAESFSENDFNSIYDIDEDKFNSASLVQGRTELYLGETAEEFGISEEELLNKQAQEYNVKVVSSKPGFEGATEIVAEGAPSNVLKFFSQGEYDNVQDFIEVFDLEVKILDVNESEELKEESFVSLEDTEGFDEATLVQGRAILFMGETAEELGVSEEEALNRQAQEYNVKIISTKSNSDGSIEVTAEGTPSNILLFFSQGDCDNSYDFKMSYELEVKNVESLGEAEELKEEYSDKLGGDPTDFVSDVESIRAMLQVIDTTQFGTRLAQQMVEDWIEACNRQIEKGKRLASGDEFYSESEGCSKQKIEEAEINEVERVHETIENAETEAEVKEAILSISDNRLESEVLSAFNQCIQDGDDLDALKGHVLATLEDNATYNESEELTEAEEVEVKNLQVIKEQGNIYMLEDENKKMIVGENYNADEGIIENAEIYENKEEADKDYLSRCDIIKDGEEFKSEEPIEEAEEINPDEPQYGEDMLENMWTAVCSNDLNYVKNAYNKNLIQPNTRYTTGSGRHSLIMGALRNKNYEMVDLLKSFGEKITKSELEEYKNEMAKRTYEDDVTKEVMDEGIIDDLKLNHRVKKADKASERYDADKSKRNKKRMNKAFNKLDAEKERQIKKHQDKINKIKKA